jgi:hypothetical protein
MYDNLTAETHNYCYQYSSAVLQLLYALLSQFYVCELLLVVAVHTSSQAAQQAQHSSLVPKTLVLPKAPIVACDTFSVQQVCNSAVSVVSILQHA